METGIFIRAQVDGKWDSVDIGDKRIPDEKILEWLRSRGGQNQWAENCVFVLLGREWTPKPEDNTKVAAYDKLLPVYQELKEALSALVKYHERQKSAIPCLADALLALAHAVELEKEITK